MPKNYIKQVAAAALNSIDSVLTNWCAGGKREGHEYVALNPNRADSNSGSFKINLSTGAWADFAIDVSGGDLVALVAYLDGVSQFEAAKLLGVFLGIEYQKSDPQKRATSPQNKAANTTTPTPKDLSEWLPLLPVPIDAPAPPLTHFKHGKPSMQWAYQLPGGVACYVYRFEAKTASERKQFAPLTYCEHATSKKREWRWQGLPEPRPLYNLDKIISNASGLVVVCEGEKAADAAAILLPDAVITTMLNGAQSPNKTDWQPLSGRDVWLWPDNDEAGQKCMAAIRNLLKVAGVASVKTINLKAFESLPVKGDAADLLTAGFAHAAMLELSQKPDFFEVEKPASTRNNQPTSNESNTDSRFHLNDGGLYYFGKNDAGNDAPPMWICSKLEVTAVTRDAKSEAWGRLLEFDDLDGVHHAWAMPMDLLSGMGNEYRSTLLAMGLQISTMPKARNLLTQYIQTAKVDVRVMCVERTGWHGGSFVMPNKTIGSNQQEKIIFQSAVNTQSTFKQKGTLASWQDNVSKPCAGNSRLVFAISAAFASPLLDVTGMESGGVHFRGDSSTGKTTALRVASSVWGGLDYLQRWRATDNGLESLAAQHSDCLLVLDELSQVDPKAAGEVAYMLANGSGKVRSIRTGAMRDTATWRLLFLSSGEAGLTEHMALAGRKPKAGQEIRLLDIPADAGRGFGIFDTLHDHIGGSAFSKALNDAVGKHYGVASIAYLSKLVDNLDKIPGHVKRLQKEFLENHLKTDAGGQAYRGALRFALIAAAGEIATVWGVTGWASGEAIKAADTCFKAWLMQRGGAGNAEERAMLAQVQRFFELHCESRFSDWERPASDTSQHAPKTLNKAGYRKHFDAKDADGQPVYTGENYADGDEKKARDTEFYVYTETFRSEICAGYDYKVIQKLLDRHGALIRPSVGNAYTRSERLPSEGSQNIYRLNSKVFGLLAENDAD